MKWTMSFVWERFLVFENISGAAYLGESPVCSWTLWDPTARAAPATFANPKSQIIPRKKKKIILIVICFISK